MMHDIAAGLKRDPWAAALCCVGLVVVAIGWNAAGTRYGLSHPSARSAAPVTPAIKASCARPTPYGGEPLTSSSIYVVGIDGADSVARSVCEGLSARFDVPIVVLPGISSPATARHPGREDRLASQDVLRHVSSTFHVDKAQGVQVIAVVDTDIYMSGRVGGREGGFVFADTSMYGEGAATATSSVISTYGMGPQGSADARERTARFAEILIARSRYGLAGSTAAGAGYVGPVLSLRQLDGIRASACDYRSDVERLAPAHASELRC